jgi:hypothetical protein
MKNLIILIGLIGFISGTNAQSKNDPTYSAGNYKHPNKAAEAKLTKQEGSDNLSYTNETNVQNRNYKAQTANEEQSGAAMLVFPVEKNTNSVASAGNYKSQFGKKAPEIKSEPTFENAPVAQKTR